MAETQTWHNLPEWVKPSACLVAGLHSLSAVAILVFSERKLGELVFAAAFILGACYVLWVWRRTADSVVMSPDWLIVYRNDGTAQIQWNRISDVRFSGWSAALSGCYWIKVETFGRSGTFRTYSFAVWTTPDVAVKGQSVDELVSRIREQAENNSRTSTPTHA